MKRAAAALLLSTMTALQAVAATPSTAIAPTAIAPTADAPATSMPATAYVSDELVLGVYSEENGQGQRLATLHSGAVLEILSVSGESTEIRLPDGTTGWVKSSYLTTKEPAVVRVKQLEEELDRSRATTPALAEAAARNEVLQLKRELDEARAVVRNAPAADAGTPGGLSTAATAVSSISAWLAGGGALAALAAGFWLGYATLARRVRSRFGGLKVY
jgi:SH3-like domain-containing protein